MLRPWQSGRGMDPSAHCGASRPNPKAFHNFGLFNKFSFLVLVFLEKRDADSLASREGA